jgi:hypothetical protein
MIMAAFRQREAGNVITDHTWGHLIQTNKLQILGRWICLTTSIILYALAHNV